MPVGQTAEDKAAESRPTASAEEAAEGAGADRSWRPSRLELQQLRPRRRLGVDEPVGSGSLQEVIEKLQEFEKKNWNEIIRGGSHPIPVTDIMKPARDRLQTIHKDDTDELMSFRLTGTNRVWCIRQLNVMKVLWWDPDHQICPAPKKRT